MEKIKIGLSREEINFPRKTTYEIQTNFEAIEPIHFESNKKINKVIKIV